MTSPREQYDIEQAKKRTTQQNAAIVGLITGIGVQDDFAYSEMKKMGEAVEVQHIQSKRKFSIPPDGMAVEIKDGEGSS